ncbi:DUF5630 domain-containing protein [Legionella drozanskii]|uniref:Uncharacterized protein n=1 Tax=Legionella drozanskii LLAP-1 TaxID=1212489 RepID=A0A0W0SRT6_9GAMM|nr:DUF5630 domain-containing protein [Legionella drozanskii]KTC85913.1 hypothetical protein Ldro_2238 [Legionella drozanskii LLAP-1]
MGVNAYTLPLLALSHSEKLDTASFIVFATRLASSKEAAQRDEGSQEPTTQYKEDLAPTEELHLRKLLESIENFSSEKSKVDPEPSLTPEDLHYLHQFIENSDVALLIKLSIQNPAVNTLCNHPSLNDFWNEKWRKCGRNPSERAQTNHNPIHEYLPQPTITTFELIKGLFVYSQYIELSKTNLKNQKSSEQYLKLAAELNYFPALNALCARALKKNEPLKAIIYAQIAAQYYWTPGFLLLTSVYYSFKLYPNALQSLMICEKLRPFSDVMINNAYQGKTLEQISEPLMTQLKVSRWDETISLMAQRANFPKVSLIPNSFFSNARQTVAELTKVLQQDLSPELELAAGEAEQGAEAELFHL